MKSIFHCVFAALMFSTKMSMAGDSGGAVEGTTVAQSGSDVFSADTKAGTSQAGAADPIAPFAPEIAGGGNQAAGSSGGTAEINDNYRFGAHKLAPGGGSKSGD